MTPSGVTGWSRTRNRDGTGSRRSPVVCGLFLLPVSLQPVSTPQHRQDLYHFGSLCGIRITFKARAGP